MLIVGCCLWVLFVVVLLMFVIGWFFLWCYVFGYCVECMVGSGVLWIVMVGFVLVCCGV